MARKQWKKKPHRTQTAPQNRQTKDAAPRTFTPQLLDETLIDSQVIGQLSTQPHSDEAVIVGFHTEPDIMNFALICRIAVWAGSIDKLNLVGLSDKLNLDKEQSRELWCEAANAAAHFMNFKRSEFREACRVLGTMAEVGINADPDNLPELPSEPYLLYGLWFALCRCAQHRRLDGRESLANYLIALLRIKIFEKLSDCDLDSGQLPDLTELKKFQAQKGSVPINELQLPDSAEWYRQGSITVNTVEVSDCTEEFEEVAHFDLEGFLKKLTPPHLKTAKSRNNSMDSRMPEELSLKSRPKSGQKQELDTLIFTTRTSLYVLLQTARWALDPQFVLQAAKENQTEGMVLLYVHLKRVAELFAPHIIVDLPDEELFVRQAVQCTFLTGAQQQIIFMTLEGLKGHAAMLEPFFALTDYLEGVASTIDRIHNMSCVRIAQLRELLYKYSTDSFAEQPSVPLDDDTVLGLVEKFKERNWRFYFAQREQV